MDRRAAFAVVLALLVLAVPLLCHGGVIEHSCECGAGVCSHDACGEDVCATLLRRGGEDEHDTGLAKLRDLAGLAWVQWTFRPDTACLAASRACHRGESPAPPGSGLSVHTSDVPLRL